MKCFGLNFSRIKWLWNPTVLLYHFFSIYFHRTIKDW